MMWDAEALHPRRSCAQSLRLGCAPPCKWEGCDDSQNAGHWGPLWATCSEQLALDWKAGLRPVKRLHPYKPAL